VERPPRSPLSGHAATHQGVIERPEILDHGP
jgi:hypothetical protein